MSLEQMKVSKTTVYELETLAIIDRKMSEKNKNFSKAVNLLIKQGDYLEKKIRMLREEKKLNG